jgi:RNA polymerase sigma-70 factor (ECF subfamily)
MSTVSPDRHPRGVLDEPQLRSVVARAAHHDPDAWEQLYRHAHRRLWSYTRRRLFDAQAADDAVSETMTRALHSIERFTWQRAGFDAWLYGIARNVVFEMGRTRRRDVTVDAAPWPAASPGPEERTIARLEADALRSAFERLEPAEREVLELRINGGLSAEQAGAVLGKQAGAVRMAQSRALNRLRIMLEEVHRAY